MKKKYDTVNILTHCNAGWLATINWGTATSPIYNQFMYGFRNKTKKSRSQLNFI